MYFCFYLMRFMYFIWFGLQIYWKCIFILELETTWWAWLRWRLVCCLTAPNYYLSKWCSVSNTVIQASFVNLNGALPWGLVNLIWFPCQIQNDGWYHIRSLFLWYSIGIHFFHLNNTSQELCTWLKNFVVGHCSILPIRVTSLVLGQWHDCPSAKDVSDRYG